MKEILLKEINNKENILKVKAHLQNDGLIIYPTDTLYGLGCNFFSKKAKSKINRIKKREHLHYSVIVSGMEMLNSLLNSPSSGNEQLMKKLFPGKVTVILKVSVKKYYESDAKISTLGVRIPDVPELTRLVKDLAFPVVTTSVNHSSHKPINRIDKIIEFIDTSEFGDEIILINGGNLPPSSGSTIIDLTTNKPLIIREGDDLKRVVNLIY